jgi:glycosyltransferase involved in cell wall biosynthesis
MKLCYFGIYDPEFGRNAVYISGLRQNGVEIIECRDTSRGLSKFLHLWKKHADILKRGGYDALVVGYPGHLVVPFAKLVSKKPVIFDALATLYEGEVISRGRYQKNPLMKAWINLIDTLAVKFADVILVETNAQKEYFIKRFGVVPGKVFRVFTGVDESRVKPDHFIQKREKFTAVFRGKFLPEAGVKYIVRAAKLLEQQGVDILILGNGLLEDEVGGQIDTLKPLNLYWIHKHLDASKLYQKMQECHVSLGQFEKHERLERTIPHKAFESLALGMPYITGRAQGISELLTDGKDCLMTNLADPEDLAAKILQLKNQPEFASRLGANGHELYEGKLSPKQLAKGIMSAILSVK